MNKPYNFLLLFVAVLCTLTSCSRSIKIDITRRSSELNNCENVFGTDLKALKLENAILLQTGVMDTTDKQAPIPVAIIIIDKKEIFLKLKSRSEVLNETTRLYEAERYKVHLNYKRHLNDYNETFFKGTFLIEYKNLKSEYNIEGTVCNL